MSYLRNKNQTIELLLCIFLGYFGVHRFYAGKKKSGFLYLFTVGLCGIGWIYDIIAISIRILNKKSKPRVLTEEDFRAAGVTYHEKNIEKLACSNPDWKSSTTQIIEAGKSEQRIYRYNYINKPVKLIPEPNNEHDENAVAVLIAGELVGYISRGDNLHVKDILDNREIISISGFIGGGEYKIISDDGSISKFEDRHSVNIRIKYI